MFLDDLHLFIEHCESADYSDDATISVCIFPCVWTIHMEIYKLRLKPSYNMMSIIQNFGVNKIKWKYIMIKLHI